MDPFAHAGALADAYRAVDWSRSPVGDPSTWSPTLLQALETAWSSRFPITLIWGPELVLLYNEAYVALIGDKHPAALGERTRTVFPEAWDGIAPLLEQATRGEATWSADALIPLVRHGHLEDCYFTFSYSPVRSAAGVIEGVVDISVETTRQVVDARRLALLSELGIALSGSASATQVAQRAAEVLAGDPADLPALALRLPRSTPAAEAVDEAGAGAPVLPAAPSAPWDGDRPLLEPVDGGVLAWLPVRVTGARSERGGHLVVRLPPALAADPDHLAFLALVARAVERALDAVAVLEAERRAVADERRLSEVLQHSLLTPPAQPAGVAVAVRYEPAGEQASIGGDWYDAFVLPDGDLVVAIGDVAGHDRDAAALMGQARNLLRGIAYATQAAASRVLSLLDEALEGLGLDTTATAVVARLGPPVDHDGAQGRSLRWSNAGHPPPLLLGADGRVRLLDHRSDLLLGLDPAAARADHEVLLAPGDTLVMCTDGLVEHRRQPLDVGLGRLADLLHGQQDLDVETLCDRLVAGSERHTEDDVVVLVVRVQARQGSESTAVRRVTSRPTGSSPSA